MKKIYTILIMCVFLSVCSTDANAQIIKAEAFLGGNLSKVIGDNLYNGYSRFGLHGGIGAIVPVYQKGDFNIDFSLELAFNQRGSHQDSIINTNNVDGSHITSEYNLYMNYLEVPVLLYFSDRNIYSLGIGASYGRLVDLKEYEHGKLTNVNLTYTGNDKYKLDDFCFIADAKIRLYERLKLGFRFQHSIRAIRTRNFQNLNGENIPDAYGNINWTQYNNSITVRLIYVFNENRSQYIYDQYEFRGDNPKIHQKAIDKKLKKLRKKEAREERKKQRRN